MDASGYVFVLTAIDVDVDTPYEIIPNHFLQRANDDQIKNIKDILTQLTFFWPLAWNYEQSHIAKPGDKPGIINYERHKLSQEAWRYWIVFFEGTNKDLQELQYALLLMEEDLELGFTLFNDDHGLGTGCVHNSDFLHSFFSGIVWFNQSPKVVKGADLQLAQRCYTRLLDLPDTFDHISAFQRYNNLRSFPRSSELQVIGLFSVIESLLAHAPKLTESADSLTHQIREKMPLVRKRFVRPLDNTRYFNDITECALWPKLYKYRSMIVHGERADISGDLQALRDHQSVTAFLRDTVKLLLIESLDEPELLTDLKRC